MGEFARPSFWLEMNVFLQENYDFLGERKLQESLKNPLTLSVF